MVVVFFPLLDLDFGCLVVGCGLCFSLVVVVVAGPSHGWGLTCVSLF